MMKLMLIRNGELRLQLIPPHQKVATIQYINRYIFISVTLIFFQVEVFSLLLFFKVLFRCKVAKSLATNVVASTCIVYSISEKFIFTISTIHTFNTRNTIISQIDYQTLIYGATQIVMDFVNLQSLKIHYVPIVSHKLNAIQSNINITPETLYYSDDIQQPGILSILSLSQKHVSQMSGVLIMSN